MTSSLSQPNQIILEAIEKLRDCSLVNIQTNWRSHTADLSLAEVMKLDWLQHPTVQLNAKNHIAWSQGKKVLWLWQKLVIPHNLQGYRLQGLCLRLLLTWWAEAAEIYVNNRLVQTGDLFDCATRVLLSPSITPGEEITVALRLVSPGHDHGALVKSLCVYESNSSDRLEPGFIADELAVLQRYLESFEPEKLSNLATAIANNNWLALPEQFEVSLAQIRSSLNCFPQIKQRCIYLLGHAHLDLAWLWSISETWDAAQRTFKSVLNLQTEFPNLIFCHSTPALYAWIEQHRPDLFTAITQQVAAGRWEVVGGLWVEPELNLISGESIARQLLYGQRYVLEKFGKISTIAWLPDTFGFCATLPQFLGLGGIEYFVTQKLRWNDTTEFPHGAFWWRSPDGTELFSLMSAPIGEGIDPTKMAEYACNWEQETNLSDFLWLPGVGDHGGGPSRDMLEVAQRWQNSPFFPRLEFSTAEKYLQQIVATQEKFPVWNDELYLEFHRGCYTTHADQKLWNRRCEDLLYEAELFAALATITAGVAYPQAELTAAWKKVLFNQFHDILPGSSIPDVYLDANSAWQEVAQVGSEILQQSLSAIASLIAFPHPPHPQAQPVVVFNALNWETSQVVSISLPNSEQKWTIYNLAKEQLPYQLGEESTLLFLANDIPAVGYSVFWLCPENAAKPSQDNTIRNYRNIIPVNDDYYKKHSFTPKDFVLENEFLRVIVDSSNGDLCSVFDKINHKEVLDKVGNQLQAFQDSGQYWDAWNIDPNYAQHPLPPTQLKSIQWLEYGVIKNSIRVVRQIGKSEFCQDYILETRSPILKIVTTVNWQERQVLVKAAFNLNLEANYATYEIPCGAIQRPTKPQTEAEKAKWEVPALRWADLSTDGYGVSLLNDCKYGYDSKSNQLRLTLLRSPNWPNPEADYGFHKFTYALYPHSHSWQQAQTVRRGYELNIPLQVMLLPAISNSTSGQLAVTGQLLNLQDENLILMAFKQSEDDPAKWILRCYEANGKTANLKLQSDLGLKVTNSVDLLERSLNPSESADGQIFKIQPWKIATFIVSASQNLQVKN